MIQHPIYLSDTVYQLLDKRAADENRLLEQVAKRLFAQDLVLLLSYTIGKKHQKIWMKL